MTEEQSTAEIPTQGGESPRDLPPDEDSHTSVDEQEHINQNQQPPVDRDEKIEKFAYVDLEDNESDEGPKKRIPKRLQQYQRQQISREELLLKQERAEERRRALQEAAEARRAELNRKTASIMMHYEFIDRQQRIRRGHIPGERPAPPQEVNKSIAVISHNLNVLNSGLRHTLTQAEQDAARLTGQQLGYQ